MIKTAVVILNWNGIGWLQKFLKTVVRFSDGPDTLIYMADNGSTDGSADWVSENCTEIEIIRFKNNLGFAGGYNLALKQIKAEYYVLLNSDVEVTEGWLSPLVSYMDHNSNVASCQPKIRSFDNKDFFEYAGAAGGFIDKFGYTFCRGRIFDHIEMDNGQYDDCRDIFWSTGACMMVRSEAWTKCGGFDDDFFAHMEEVDLCWRFHLAGFSVSYVPESTVYHVGGGALPYNSELKTYLNFRNNLFLLYKNLQDNKLHRTIFARKILDGIAATVFTFNGHPGNVKAIWKAHMDYYKSIESLKKKRKLVREMTVNKNVTHIMNKSIVFGFYIRGKKTFNSLNIQI
jgi:GT2 family glycosyltransferase